MSDLDELKHRAPTRYETAPLCTLCGFNMLSTGAYHLVCPVALKRYGDRRAAEMRERAAAWCDGQADLYNAYRERDERSGSPNAERMRDHFMTLADAARHIRALPLDPPETT